MLTDIVTRGSIWARARAREDRPQDHQDARAIREAFQKLLIEKGIDKITVSALAREADIDRKTFYLHFRSIDELIQQEADTLVERVAGALTTTVHDDDPVFLNMRRVLVELCQRGRRERNALPARHLIAFHGPDGQHAVQPRPSRGARKRQGIAARGDPGSTTSCASTSRGPCPSSSNGS